MLVRNGSLSSWCVIYQIKRIEMCTLFYKLSIFFYYYLFLLFWCWDIFSHWRCTLARLHHLFHPQFPSSFLLSSLETACILLFTEGSSAWIIWLRRYWCIKLRVWFLSRPCHQSQFARTLAECNISLIRSTRKLRP